MCFDRLIPVALCLVLAACSSVPGGPAEGINRQAFFDGLAAEPEVCRQYRDLYVQGFKTNVRAISGSDDAPVSFENALKSEAVTLLKQSTLVLAAAGVPQEACARPYCIIEPLQNGQLDSWCGYRLSADQGEELYQWLNWSEARNSVSSL